MGYLYHLMCRGLVLRKEHMLYRISPSHENSVRTRTEQPPAAKTTIFAGDKYHYSERECTLLVEDNLEVAVEASNQFVGLSLSHTETLHPTPCTLNLEL